MKKVKYDDDLRFRLVIFLLGVLNFGLFAIENQRYHYMTWEGFWLFFIAFQLIPDFIEFMFLLHEYLTSFIKQLIRIGRGLALNKLVGDLFADW